VRKRLIFQKRINGKTGFRRPRCLLAGLKPVFLTKKQAVPWHWRRKAEAKEEE